MKETQEREKIKNLTIKSVGGAGVDFMELTWNAPEEELPSWSCGAGVGMAWAEAILLFFWVAPLVHCNIVRVVRWKCIDALPNSEFDFILVCSELGI